jgi:hypothetical protein
MRSEHPVEKDETVKQKAAVAEFSLVTSCDTRSFSGFTLSEMKFISLFSVPIMTVEKAHV